jgi:P27 family predicted phage terminase small subunit
MKKGRGRRGPPPKPSKLKKLQGTHRKDRAAPRELDAKPGVPTMPAWLNAEARAEWKRIVPQLDALKILSDIDGAMLADYCTAHALAVNATKKYQREGLTVKVNGQLQKHPAVKIAQEARSQAARLAAEFGLSPSSRTRISAPDDESALNAANERMKQARVSTAGGGPVDPAADFLFKPRLVPKAPEAPAAAPAPAQPEAKKEETA